jgi:hypothetical protein
MYLIKPVADKPGLSATTILKTLLGNGWFILSDRTYHRKNLQAGDWICFYMKSKGIVAKACVTSVPRREPLPFQIPQLEQENYSWSFKVDKVEFYLEKPIVLNERIRAKLECFRGKDPKRSWAWFVQSTRAISEADFHVLTTGVSEA